MKTYPATITLALLAASCMNRPPATEIMPPGLLRTLRRFLRNSSEEDIRTRAVSLAQEHVRAGTPYVARCGMAALYRPNIPEDKEHLVADLPSLDLPCGFMDPLAFKGAWFALAYNAELLKHLPLTR